ncbi:hypothetical protein BVY03_04475 [bacterium K02(2017)]|nr:hypothetical protein BVY03_04475 [bacterium K02(2017)]
MVHFKQIFNRAVKRKGNKKELNKLLPNVKSVKLIKSIKDDRVLAAMSKCVFQAGFSWKVIEKKWPTFETAFHKFSINKLSSLSPDQWDEYGHDTRVVRNMQKIMSVAHNVSFIADIKKEYKSFGRFIAQWPEDDLVGLFIYLKKHGSRLGGMTSQILLRRLGKDTFMLTPDVIACIKLTGLSIADHPTSKRDLYAIQNLFNDLRDNTKLPYSHLSRIMSCSIGSNYPVDQIVKAMSVSA